MKIFIKSILIIPFLIVTFSCAENERCDELAVAASKTNNPAIDTAYEQEQKNLL